MNASEYSERNKLAVSIVKLVSRVVLSPFFKMNIRGIDNIPEKGSFVLLPKHQRWEDIPLIAISIKRPLYFVAKQELFDNVLSKKFISMLGGLPLDRSRPARSRSTYLKLLNKLSEGEGVVVFPEGTYYKDQVGPGHEGLVRMLLSNSDTLIIPAGIRYRREKSRMEARIIIGKSVQRTDFVSVKELFSHVMAQIAFLSGC